MTASSEVAGHAPATVVVTGSASGMGAAASSLLRSRGWRVIGVDLHDADVVADLSTSSGRAEVCTSVATLTDGKLDAVAAFAGISGFGDRPGSLVVSVDYFGAVVVLEGLRPLLAAATGAAAIAISSNSATTTPDVDAALIEACLEGDEDGARARADEVGAPMSYAAAKFALARWVRRAATTPRWIGAGITLNALAPGVVETPIVAEMRADPAGLRVLERMRLPVGRPGRPEEVASLTAFMLSAESRFIVGSLIHIDGGTDALLRADDWPSVRRPRSST